MLFAPIYVNDSNIFFSVRLTIPVFMSMAKVNTFFLAPTGAQGMLMPVCPSVRDKFVVEQSIFIF